MPSANVRIAYIKRMLKRLDEEVLRLDRLVINGELTPQGAELGKLQLDRNRLSLESELRAFEPELVAL